MVAKLPATPSPDETEEEFAPRAEETLAIRHRRKGGFGRLLAESPLMRDRVPLRYRPALFFETFYNVGTGAFITLFLLSSVVLKTVIDGTENHLAILAALFGGSSLFSPLVSYLGRWIPMKSLVVYPNLLVAALLLATALPFSGPWMFTLTVGAAFVIRVFPRMGEMNMYRILYPPTHRGAAVGWVKGVSAVSALVVTLLGYWWFSFYPSRYWWLYALVAGLLLLSAMCYRRIPVSKNNVFARPERQSPLSAFREGCRIFFSDRRFMLFQAGFWFAGFANHMGIVYVAEVLKEHVIRPLPLEGLLPGPLERLCLVTWQLDRGTVETLIVGFIVAVLPVLLMMTSAPFWGRFLDRINPMFGRSIFNTMQCVAYALHAWGGLTLQIWPMLAGSALHAFSNGGGTINWLTGSMYFAKADRVSLYNAIHVGLTGVRGMIAPLCGWYLYSARGLNLGAGLFWVSAGLSLVGAVMMLWQGLVDPGPREK